MAQAYIGLGSNLGDGPSRIHAATKALEHNEALSRVRVSSLYRTAPWGRGDQADFTNAAAEVETALEPDELLRELQAIETRMHRDRSVGRWGPRTIDLDLLMYEHLSMQSANLVLPHPRLHQRKFVLAPLLELNPGIVIPGIGPGADCLVLVENQRVEKIE